MSLIRWCTVTVAAALVWTGCGGSSSQDAELSAADRGTTSTSTTVAGSATPDQGEGEAGGTPAEASGGASSPAAPDSPATTAAPSNTTTTSASSPATPASQPAKPVAPGHYEYDTDGTTQVANGVPRPLPEVTTLDVDNASGKRQRSLRDLRDEDGIGATTEQILLFAADGVHLVYLKLQTSIAGVTNTYEFQPSDPPLVVKTGAVAGDTTTFTLQGDGVTIETTATVKGTETVTVAGKKVEALILNLTSQLSGALQGTQDATSWIDPDRSLTVKEDVKSDVRSGQVRIRTNYVATVRKLTPS